MIRVTAGVVGVAVLAGCGGPPTPPPSPESQAVFVLDGKIYDDLQRPTPGITVHLFPVGEAEPIGSTRSDSTGRYRIEVTEGKPPTRMLVILNSNRHVHHDSRFLPDQDRIDLPDQGNTLHRLYYLAPVSEAPPSKGGIYVIKDLCNVRSAPSTDSSVVTQVKKGQSLKFLERDGDWIWVETRNGARGWIYRMLVTTLDHRMPQ
ncbi:MAG: SH3 domain-containing protein [Candidatus Eisenbacteria sp.]|nr:SH3 domain-containing protein [Candidatus Eisenbacteria bacterium]